MASCQLCICVTREYCFKRLHLKFRFHWRRFKQDLMGVCCMIDVVLLHV